MSEIKNILEVTKEQKCCSCGICAGVCPVNAIQVSLINGILTPAIDEEVCINCGACKDICPGKSAITEVLSTPIEEVENKIKGQVLNTYIAKAKDNGILSAATSGGVITTVIKKCLADGMIVFTINTDCFAEAVKTEMIIEESHLYFTMKSRYISVSHEDAVRYMLHNKNQRMVLIGTGCAITGIRRVIERYHLNRENYLLLGLLCDKLMSYHVWDYFAKAGKKQGNLLGMHFRDKAVGGWPGGVKLRLENKEISLPKRSRAEVKDLFCHPRCLYCINKLNTDCDLAVGDNYTDEHKDKLGSSCVIIRTQAGENAFQSVRNELEVYPVELSKIYKSQECSKKKENFLFARKKFLKERSGCSKKTLLKYYYKNWKIKLGNRFYKNMMIMKFLILADSKLK